ncbi:MAG: methyltransferase domain-containing protein [Spirochaetia bacterium]|nr:methyltransferase domain-containing protein [Spirochaetia bacterium]
MLLKQNNESSACAGESNQTWNSSLYDSSHNFVSKLGAPLLSLLAPGGTESILDLGCGTGDLTFEIATKAKRVIGVDQSLAMIEAAKRKYPQIEFSCVDALDLDFEASLDAVFSNAVLHWIQDQKKLSNILFRALKPGGRLVVEFGGKGNNQSTLDALRSVLRENRYFENANIDFWFYPSIGEYASILEESGFLVSRCEHFDRPTRLSGVDGMKDWFRMFGENFFVNIPEAEKERMLDQIQDRLRPQQYCEDAWFADYKRIRVVASKPRGSI